MMDDHRGAPWGRMAQSGARRTYGGFSFAYLMKVFCGRFLEVLLTFKMVGVVDEVNT